MFNISWFFLRFASFSTFSGFLFDLEIGLASVGFLLFHIILGLRSVLKDYIHTKKVKILSLSLLRIVSIELWLKF
uniref:Succinate:cytochrome c oxidoreductase subunit 4 n=1 Tax=Rhodymenia pseudopalmata TaxID=31502 RepID=V9NGB7_RHOPU|nr:succinate:cytochrome c oxidoreductase subunit 4 [Rhodymenia pseudopalmata]AGO19273.1 succinate:cytochrome c oxidoreductase subunit 4 [Rhodymenia pseudopalmata]